MYRSVSQEVSCSFINVFLMVILVCQMVNTEAFAMSVAFACYHVRWYTISTGIYIMGFSWYIFQLWSMVVFWDSSDRVQDCPISKFGDKAVVKNNRVLIHEQYSSCSYPKLGLISNRRLHRKWLSELSRNLSLLGSIFTLFQCTKQHLHRYSAHLFPYICTNPVSSWS